MLPSRLAVIGIWLLGATAEITNPNVSDKPCSELPRFLKGFGSEDVCAASRVGPTGECLDAPGVSSWNDALMICVDLGARLCSVQDLANDEAKGTGCQLDNARVWSGTKDGCGEGLAASAAGAGTFLGNVPIECTAQDMLLSVRCCADAYADPCSTDRCSTGANPLNTCYREGPEHKCQCAGRGWTSGPSMKSCVEPSDACLGFDRCNSKFNPENRCQSLSATSFACKCATSWRSSSPGAPCVPCNDPCAGNPCSSEIRNNVCEAGSRTADGCLSYTCTCRSQGYVTPMNEQYCTKCDSNSCASDPCGIAAGSASACSVVSTSASVCPSFECSCNPGFSSSDLKRCVMCTNPCLSDPCDSSARCEVDRSGTGCPKSKCICDAPYVLTLDRKECRLCPDNCARDPCDVGRNPGSSCRMRYFEGDDTMQCPTRHECTCAGNDHVSDDLQSCVVCKDICKLGDPCNTQAGNKCKTVADGSHCPVEFVCECSEPNSFVTGGGTKCVNCDDPCSAAPGDPCKTRGTDNQCAAVTSRSVDVKGCPTTFECKCPSALWIPTKARKGCLQCPDPCSDDPCSSGESPSNTCTPKYGPSDATSGCPTSYTCECVELPWVTPLDRKSCEKCADPCLNLNCHTESENNKCVYQFAPRDDPLGCPSEAFCECGNVAFTQGSDPYSCEKCSDPCAGNACGQYDDDKNSCDIVAGDMFSCPSRVCTCNYPFFSTNVGRQGCDACPDTCAGDPCRVRENESNRCTLARAPNDRQRDCPSSYICSCAGLGWVTPVDQQFCTKCDNPCDSNPCFSTGNRANVCEPRFLPNDGLCPSEVQCNCLSFGFAATADRRSCKRCPDPCQGDPCNRLGEPSNICVPLVPAPGSTECAGYTCKCMGVGFALANNGQTCERCPNLCDQGDPCLHEVNPMNTCQLDISQPGVCGGYYCSCRGDGYFPNLGTLICSPCIDPCTENPCRGNEDGANVCVSQGPTRRQWQDALLGEVNPYCGDFVCTCGGIDWVVSSARDKCVLCTDPCESEFNPCGDAEGNTCTVLPSPASGLYLTAAKDIAACTAYQCQCSAPGWVSPDDRLSCLPCPNPCVRNACGEELDKANKCEPSGFVPTVLRRQAGFEKAYLAPRSNSCPGYTCNCAGEGYVATAGRQSCSRCDDPCLKGDPCNYNFNKGNLCLATYVPSVRRQAGLTTTMTAEEECGAYTCECADGWVFDTASKTCVACPNPCTFGDPCGTGPDGRNACQPHHDIPGFQPGDDAGNAWNYDGLSEDVAQLCGGYTCSCEAPGWLMAADEQSCSVCPNPCEDSDPCFHGEDDRNICVPDAAPVRRQGMLNSGSMAALMQEKCGGYKCICGGATWYSPDSKQTCMVCENPCMGDPCNTELNQANICTPKSLPSPVVDRRIDNFEAKCPSHTCSCRGEAWLASTDRRQCTPCPNPCASHDPCSADEEPRNLCIPKKNVPQVPMDWLPSGGSRGLLQVDLRSTAISDEEKAYMTVMSVCGGYTCQCNGEGWRPAKSGQKCERCPNPCKINNDACHESVDPRNRCVPDTDFYLRRSHQNMGLTGGSSSHLGCGGYTCECASSGWIQPVDQQSCRPCPNPCLGGDPCSRNSNGQNTCVPDMMVPDYDGPGRRSHEADQTLYPGQCGGYTCQCSPGWITPYDMQSCTRCPNPCQGIDPCKNEADPRNLCTPQYGGGPMRRSHDSGSYSGGDLSQCGGFTCECGGAGWTNGFSKQTCEECPNPCMGADACGTSDDSRNYCIPHYEAGNNDLRRQAEEAPPPLAPDVNRTQAYLAGADKEASSRQFNNGNAFASGGTRINAPQVMQGFSSMNSPAGIRPATNRVSVSAPAGMPAVGQFTQANSQMMATPQPASNAQFMAAPLTSNMVTFAPPNKNPLGHCGVYRCECSAPGWMMVGDHMGCTRCPNPCLANEDPCAVRTGSANKCVRTTNPANNGYDQNDPMRKCGSFTCECGRGFVTSSSGKGCEPCPNPCQGRDPCATSQHQSNRCIPQDGDPLRRSHQTDDPNNFYFQGGQCGGYTCECAGPVKGWIATGDRNVCIPCQNPCEVSDPCASAMDPRNMCVPNNNMNSYGQDGNSCGGYACQCKGVGFVSAPGGQSCRTCPNPCLTSDPCNTRLDPSNVCTPNFSGSSSGGSVAETSESLRVKLMKQMLGIPVENTFVQEQRNTNPSSCGRHTCQCNGGGFASGANSRTCVYQAPEITTCQDPCLTDPCNTRLNPGNRCINQANVQCGYYECSCAAGWQSVQPVVTQGPTCQVVGDNRRGDVSAENRRVNLNF